MMAQLVKTSGNLSRPPTSIKAARSEIGAARSEIGAARSEIGIAFPERLQFLWVPIMSLDHEPWSTAIPIFRIHEKLPLANIWHSWLIQHEIVWRRSFEILATTINWLATESLIS